jgi:PAS domain S-box-containing protein
MIRKRPSIPFIVSLVFVALFLVFVAGYLAGIRQAQEAANAPVKTSKLNLGPIHLTVSADALGLVVLIILGILILTTGLLAVLAHRRRKRVMAVEKEVEETRQQLATIVESSDDAIISKTLDGIITSWNRGAEKLFGYSAEEMMGQSMNRLFPPELATEEAEILALLAAGQSIDHLETSRIRKGGERVDVSVVVSPIEDGNGNIVGASNIARDITARKQAEKKVRAQLGSLDLLQQITRAMGERQDLNSIFQVVIRRLINDLPLEFCSICLADAAAKVLTVASLGFRSEALAMEISLPEQTPIDINQNGLSNFVGEQLVYEPDLDRVAMPFPERLAQAGLRSLVVAPLLVEGKVFGILMAARQDSHSFSSADCEFLRQLSEHVALAAHHAQLYGALQQAYEDLRQTQQAVMQQERLRALGQMASGIAHDINNAITPMMLYVGSLLEKEENLSQRGRKALEVIERAVDDVSATVARLNDFYRRREPQLTLAPVQLGTLIQQVLDFTRVRWSDMPQKRGIVIETQIDLAPNLPAIMGVEGEIREALTNLVFNALDAMPEGGRLILRTSVTNGEGIAEARNVQVDVTDTGMGMDEDTRRRCLEPFFTTKGERGTGLGLAMVYGMAQRHNADIEIESEIGGGTMVRLTFAVPDKTALTSSENAASMAALAPQRILLVDDDALLLKTLTDVLTADGHQVRAASGGQQGIEYFDEARKEGKGFDVVITDLGMPYVDGNQVASAVKAASPQIPVILFSGWGKRLAAEGEVPANVDFLLSKPPKLHELRGALTHCCLKSNL